MQSYVHSLKIRIPKRRYLMDPARATCLLPGEGKAGDLDNATEIVSNGRRTSPQRQNECYKGKDFVHGGRGGAHYKI